MRALSRVKRAFFSTMDRIHLRHLRRLDDPHGPRMASVVSALGVRDLAVEDERVARIEEQRREWLASEEDLVSGALGVGREWDEGVTLGSACAASKDPVPASLLFLLVEEFRPRLVLELSSPSERRHRPAS